ncbi:uncharacterized protein UBRO_03620 [Ustilago bromivora]|uniref:Uncharacterized protein n=2 Tax=Ustilago bromivora TaxID=307758 RepID=A0A1K0G6C4_9BASI|nr:uncharacterized protein UBRO_03620 [Ustilago bromivora]
MSATPMHALTYAGDGTFQPHAIPDIATARYTKQEAMSAVPGVSASPPPPLPVTRSAQPPPTQSDFLLSQVRAILRYLSEVGLFDALIHRQIHGLLIKGAITPNPDHLTSSSTTMRSAESQEELGKKNAWLRKTLSETSFLPTTVETALSLLAGPLLSDDQKDAIVELVEYSQKGVAQKITDPTLQKRTLSGAKTAQSSTTKAVSGWTKSLKEEKERKKAEDKEKKDQKKREKEERKQIKEELKRERNEVVRKRQQEMLRSESGGIVRLVASPTSTMGPQSVTSRAELTSLEQSVASLQLHSTETESSCSDAEQEVQITNHAPINTNDWQAGTNSIADTATLTVLSDPVNSSEASMGGTNTMFLVEQGLAISCSLVVVKGGKGVGEQLQHMREQFRNVQSDAGTSGLPPPPPAHPEVLAMRRGSSGTAAPAIGSPAVGGYNASQPPIPPRPSTYKPS